MISKLMIATALSLGFAGAAVAQTQPTAPTGTEAGSTTNAGGNEKGMPMGWDGPIGDAFFLDGTLRSEAELATGWSSLTAEQQAQVKLDCTNMQASMGGATGTDAAGGAVADTTTTSSTTTGSAATTTGNATGGATSGSSASASDQTASMTQLCTMVGTM